MSFPKSIGSAEMRMRRRLLIMTTLVVSFTITQPMAVGSRPPRPTVDVSPKYGDPLGQFVFRGSGWSPDRPVRFTKSLICRTEVCPTIAFLPRRIRVDRNGRFRIRFRYPEDYATSLRTCFRQSDTTVCPVALVPPRVYALETPVTQRDVSLVIEGFYPGRQVTVLTTTPSGRRSELVVNTSRRNRRFITSERRTLFLVAGSRLLTLPTTELGLHTVEVRAGAGLGVRTVFEVRADE